MKWLSDLFKSVLAVFTGGSLEGKEAAGNTVWLFSDRMIRMMVGFVISVLFARFLGPGKFGVLSFALAFCALFTPVAQLGLDGIVVRELVKKPKNSQLILCTTLVIRSLAGVGVFLLIWATIQWLRPNEGLLHIIVVVIGLCVVFQAADIFDFWFQSKVSSRMTVLGKAPAFFVTTLFRAGLIIFNAPLFVFALSYLLEAVIGGLGLLIAYRVKCKDFSGWIFRTPVAINLLRDSWPLIFSSIAIMVYMRIDQIMIGQLVGDIEVGYYSVAVTISEAWYFLPLAIVSSTFPGIVRANGTDELMLNEKMANLYRSMAMISYAVILPIAALSGYFVPLLFGQEYTNASGMLAILMWSGLFVSLGVARSSFLTARNWTKYHLLTVSSGAVVNVALNVILIPKYAGVGAAVATGLSYWFAVHGMCFLVPDLVPTGKAMTRAMLLLQPKRVWK